MKRSAWYVALALLAGVPLQVMAADGYVTGDATLRAGPDIDYPQVDMIPAGSPIAIEGCTDGWEWCDVVFNDERGWIAGNFIQDEYEDQPVLVPAYGERLGIPVVSFSIVTYWDRYYVDRPFYHDRDRWYHRPPPHHAPPPPAHRPWVRAHRDDDRVGRDRDERPARPYPRHAPAPPHAPPYAPDDRHLPPQRPAADMDHRPPRPSAPSAPMPPQGVPVDHAPASRAPNDHRTDAHPGNPHPPAGHDKDDRHGHQAHASGGIPYLTAGPSAIGPGRTMGSSRDSCASHAESALAW